MRRLEEIEWGLAWDAQAGWSTIAQEVSDELRQLRASQRPTRDRRRARREVT